ncbi:MAG: hypothetical protein HQ581_06465 [Planctomycetes bacterium]|nr:hypothetical protein [Planctomycetota bacterium]
MTRKNIIIISIAVAAVVGIIVLVIAFRKAREEKKLTASGHQINNAAFWDGALWFAETEGKITESQGSSAKSWLIRLTAGPDQAPQQISGLDIIEPWFLAGKDRLWIFSSSTGGYYKDGKLESVKLAAPLRKVSRPFLYEGRPALIGSEAPGYRLRVWDDGKWIPKQKLRMKLPNESDDCTGEYLQAFECDGVVHVFCQVPLGAPVYYHRGLPLADAEQSWRKVADAGGQWRVASLGGNPAFFYHTSRDGLVVLGLIHREQEWKEFFSRSIGWDIGLGICATGKGEDFVLLRRILPLGMKVLGVENGQPVWAYEGMGKTNLIKVMIRDLEDASSRDRR